MKLVFITSYLLLFFQIFLVGIKTLHYQRKKKKLDMIKYEMISNLELARKLCEFAGYEVKNPIHYLTFYADIEGYLKCVNDILKYVNTKGKKKYQQDFISLQRRAKERHETLLNEYNATATKINYIISKWPKMFKGTKPSDELLLNEELLMY